MLLRRFQKIPKALAPARSLVLGGRHLLLSWAWMTVVLSLHRLQAGRVGPKGPSPRGTWWELRLSVRPSSTLLLRPAFSLARAMDRNPFAWALRHAPSLGTPVPRGARNGRALREGSQCPQGPGPAWPVPVGVRVGLPGRREGPGAPSLRIQGGLCLVSRSQQGHSAWDRAEGPRSVWEGPK